MANPLANIDSIGNTTTPTFVSKEQGGTNQDNTAVTPGYYWRADLGGGIPVPATYGPIEYGALPAGQGILQIESFNTAAIADVGIVYCVPGTGNATAHSPILKFTGSGTASWTLLGVYCQLDIAPGIGNTLTITTEKGTWGLGIWTDTSNTFTITGASFTGSDTAHSPTFVNNDLLGCYLSGTGSLASGAHMTFVIQQTAI